MDVIGVWTAGVHEVMATCGTALTTHQVQTMKRHSGRIVVNFDPDTAGANAAERSINLLLDEGMHVRILELDGGLDPDEYCKERGADVYRARLESAQNYFYWLADRARGKFDMRAAEGRVAALQFLMPAIQRLSDKLERVAVANDVAGYLGVDAGLVLEHFRKAVVERREQVVKPPEEPLRPDERILLNLLLSNPEARAELIPQLAEEPAVREFRTARIFRTLFSLHQGGSRIGFNEVHDRLEESDRSLLAAAVLVQDCDESALSLDQGRECLRSLARSAQQTELAALKARVREAERSGNMAKALQLAEQLSRLLRN
ncbi:MAG: toprim domain-containing protein [Acidobacteria bacterium]|nr:toprim domain-containing protein [Acidobacteriota bacterium]